MNLQNLKIKSFRDNTIAGKTLFSMNLALWFASIGKKTLYVDREKFDQWLDSQHQEVNRE